MRARMQGRATPLPTPRRPPDWFNQSGGLRSLRYDDLCATGVLGAGTPSCGSVGGVTFADSS